MSVTDTAGCCCGRCREILAALVCYGAACINKRSGAAQTICLVGGSSVIRRTSISQMAGERQTAMMHESQHQMQCKLQVTRMDVDKNLLRNRVTGKERTPRTNASFHSDTPGIVLYSHEAQHQMQYKLTQHVWMYTDKLNCAIA